MNTNFGLTDVLKFKLMSKVLNKGGDLDIGKIMMLQAFTSGESFKIEDALKAKLMGELFGSEKVDEDSLSEDKLMLYSMISQGEFDVQKLLQYKLMKKLIEDIDKDDEESVSKKKSSK